MIRFPHPSEQRRFVSLLICHEVDESFPPGFFSLSQRIVVSFRGSDRGQLARVYDTWNRIYVYLI